MRVSDTAEALTGDAAARIVKCARDAIAGRGTFHWALSGGGTPRALFMLLAMPEWAGRVDWKRTHVWWSDERYVPPTHSESNYRMAYETLLSKVPIPEANVHRVGTELGAEEAAAEYETQIRLQVPGVGHAFDLVLLGMGEDGHTASLFPGSLDDIPAERLVYAHWIPRVQAKRITFTPTLINAAATVMFIVTGAAKADILCRVLCGPRDPDQLPAQLVERAEWWLDAAAAAGLTR
ncbi:MAG: 6-phosphogluconolactonase [Thermoflexales bacterium]|nr:6-phosphogluconolactonase [Thermoflexales bacterium]